MSLELRQAEYSDIDEVAAVLDGAFVDDPIVPQLLPAVEVKERVAFWAAWLRGDFYKPGEKIFTIVDTSSGYDIHSYSLPESVLPLFN